MPYWNTNTMLRNGMSYWNITYLSPIFVPGPVPNEDWTWSLTPVRVPVPVPDEDRTWSLTSIGVPVPVPGEDRTWSLASVGVHVSNEDNIWFLTPTTSRSPLHRTFEKAAKGKIMSHTSQQLCQDLNSWPLVLLSSVIL